MANQAVRKVVVIRHGPRDDLGTSYQTWEVPACLTEVGGNLAKQFARDNRELLAGCKVFACSPLIRAQQTLHAIMAELGLGLDDMDEIILSNDLWTDSPREYVVHGEMLSMKDFASRKPDLSSDEGDRVFQEGIVGDVLGVMGEDDTVALCISHGGPIDFLLAEAKMRLGNLRAYVEIGDLGGCQGMILFFDEYNNLVRVDELRWKPAVAVCH